MKKLLLILMVLFATWKSNAQIVSTYYGCNTYNFRLLNDSFCDHIGWLVYDYQTSKTDTINKDSFLWYIGVDVKFTRIGKYRISRVAHTEGHWGPNLKDTSFTYELEIKKLAIWNEVTFRRRQWNNVYFFEIESPYPNPFQWNNLDSCINYFWVYSETDTSGKLISDTFAYNENKINVIVNRKGSLKLSLYVHDRCGKCDTTWNWDLYQEMFLNANWDYQAESCSTYTFTADTLSNQKFECVDVVWYVTDENKKLIESATGYTFNFTFPRNGPFRVDCYWINRCLNNQDTFWFREFDIYCDSTTMGTTTPKKPEPKVIGIYDVMGRPVQVIKEDEIIILLYDDGSTKKILQRNL